MVGEGVAARYGLVCAYKGVGEGGRGVWVPSHDQQDRF